MSKQSIFYSDFLIIGGGIAGFSAALQASHEGKAIVITKGVVGETATEKAQGGIAAAINEKDSPLYHLEDTLAAGAGLCSQEAVEALVTDGVFRVRELIEMGAKFDRKGIDFELVLEGAHQNKRILHAADATGAVIEKALAHKITREGLVEGKGQILGYELIIQDGVCRGARAFDLKSGKQLVFLAYATILATGGLGQLYLYNTNPAFAVGDGVAMGFKAGAEIQDMEFIQFHPTTFAVPSSNERFLISEAVRGEGALLINSKGKRFMPGYHKLSELAPRHIVTQAIMEEMKKTGSDFVYLDLSPIPIKRIKKHFPTIYEECKKYGIDITKDKLPVSPAAHYCMGGIKTNLSGETNVPGLYAAGEVACTGVHGANRLASNSLLEGLVFGHRAAIAASLLTFKLKKEHFKLTDIAVSAKTTASFARESEIERNLAQKIKKVLWEKAGIIRSKLSLKEALKKLDKIETEAKKLHLSPQKAQLQNMLLAAKLIAAAALERTESRGGHYRADFPKTDNKNWQKHLIYRRDKHGNIQRMA